MSETPILSITEMEAAQSQPEVVFNQAVRILEAIGQLSVIDNGLSDPPASPAEGDRYIVAGTASDDWEGHEDDIALYAGGQWLFLTPHLGWICFVEAIDDYLAWRGNTTQSWVPFP